MAKLTYAQYSNTDKPNKIMLFLHGLGADGEDLISLAEEFAEALPKACFISPNAPYMCDMAHFGYQWFSLQDRKEEVILKGIRLVEPILNEFIDNILKQHNLTDKDLYVLGFSQGAMLALHSMPRRSNKVAGVIGLSGALIAGYMLANEIKSKPKTLIIHGDQDDVVPPVALEKAANDLKANQVPYEKHMINGLGHGIDMRVIELCSKFIKNAETENN